MEIYKTIQNLKCVECEKKNIVFDLIHNEFYCRSCGLVHNSEMLDISKANYNKEQLQYLKENEPYIYNLIINEYEKRKENLLKKKMNERNQNKLNEINFLLYGYNTRKPTKIK